MQAWCWLFLIFQITYVLLRLRVQNRRKKWNFPHNFGNGIIWTAPFPLNIRNVIIWGMAFPKHLGLQKHLFRYSLKMPACMIIFKILFRQKHCTLYLYSMVTSRYQFMNLKFLYLSKKHANRTPNFSNSSGIQKRLQKAVQVRPWFLLPGLAMERISVLRKYFVTILKKVVKWAKNNQLQHVPAFIFILK